MTKSQKQLISGNTEFLCKLTNNRFSKSRLISSNFLIVQVKIVVESAVDYETEYQFNFSQYAENIVGRIYIVSFCDGERY